MNSVTLRTRDLTAIVGDNTVGAGGHLAGYNGLWSLVHRADPANLVVPLYGGLNLEHILTGEPRDGRDYFEPRNAPMELSVIDDRSAELHQPPTPITQVESWTRFTLVEPDRVAMSFRAIPRSAEALAHRVLCFFWASYINVTDVEDKAIHFRGRVDGEDADRTAWHQYSTQTHGRDSTVCRAGRRTRLPGTTGQTNALAESLSPLVWDEPFFYGHVRDMTIVMRFAPTDGLRFSHSPTGGGRDRARGFSRPAWDFQFVVTDPVVEQPYTFRAELIYRPHMTREQVLEAVAARGDDSVGMTDVTGGAT